jgi:serine/threonine protein kinase
MLEYDDVSLEIARLLSQDRVTPCDLLELLDAHQAAQPLAADVHDALAKSILEWPDDPTVATEAPMSGVSEEPPVMGLGHILQGRFRLVALVGEGGMSRVYKAVDLRRAEAGADDPYVAVKVLTLPFHHHFGSLVALQREAHKLQMLTHPNIVRVFDCDRDAQTVFMTMEYLAGRSLQSILREPGRPALGPDRGLALVESLGEALEYAHRNHIVHGDLKPANVIVTEQGTVKVIDFGMAQFLEAPGSQPKAITPRYASPEMAAGHNPEPSDDVYALACIAYEVWSGQHPFGRHGGTGGHGGAGGGGHAATLRLPRPSGMPMHQYMAVVRALAFKRRDRTPTVRRFLDELSAKQQRKTVARWVWAGLAVIPVMFAMLFGLHAPRGAAIASLQAAPPAP